jgi:hypothetical protein
MFKSKNNKKNNLMQFTTFLDFYKTYKIIIFHEMGCIESRNN